MRRKAKRQHILLDIPQIPLLDIIIKYVYKEKGFPHVGIPHVPHVG
jgi:hypothetical protein